MNRYKSKMKDRVFFDISDKEVLKKFVEFIRSEVERLEIHEPDFDNELECSYSNNILAKYRELETAKEYKERTKSDFSEETIENLFALERYKNLSKAKQNAILGNVLKEENRE